MIKYPSGKNKPSGSRISGDKKIKPVNRRYVNWLYALTASN